MAKNPTKKPTAKKPAAKRPAAKKPVHPNIGANLKDRTPEERKDYSSNARAAIRWPAHPFARRWHEPKDLVETIEQWLLDMEDANRPLTWGGFANYAGMSIGNLDMYKNGKRGENAEDVAQFQEILTMLKELIMVSKQENALIGRYNATFALADLKHNHQWTDKSQQELTGPGGKPISNGVNVHFRQTVKGKVKDGGSR